MKAVLRLFSAERVKWRKSWAMLTILLAPICQAGFLLIILSYSESLIRRFKPGFQFWLELNYLAWNLFFMPITAALVSELSWDLEHEAKAWSHLLLQPVPHRSHYLAKFLSHLSLIFLSQLLLAGILLPGGFFLQSRFGPLMGTLPVDLLLRFATFSLLASVPVVAFHTWLPLRFQGLAVSLATALAGTWLCVQLAGGSTRLAFIPWGMSSQIVVVFERWRALPWGFVPGCLFISAALLLLGSADFSRHKDSQN